MDKISIVDGTLREGEQSPGVHFTKDEKLEIARALDRVGIPLLDVGMPCVSAEEREAIRAIAHRGLRASIGVSARLSREEVDMARECDAREIFLICPVSQVHLRSKLHTDEQGIRELARDVVRYATERGLVVNFVAEDACRADVSFLCAVLREAHTWGAQRAFLCDTLGLSEPFAMRDLVLKVRDAIPPEMGLGVHCHNDLGLATANTLAAVKAGVDYPSVTVNGIGERAGNAPLHELIVAMEQHLPRMHGIDPRGLYDLSRLVEQCSGIFIPPHAPVVGLNAFRHESGIHVDGLIKDLRTYTGVEPRDWKRSPSFVLGKHTGTQTVRHFLEERGVEANERELGEILQRIKERKTGTGKEEIRQMVREIGRYYEQCLDFPMETFWEIVEGVLGRNGSRIHG